MQTASSKRAGRASSARTARDGRTGGARAAVPPRSRPAREERGEFAAIGDDDFPQPIFLLAPPRSFTSVVSGIIGQHPQLLGSPEFNLFRVRRMQEYLGERRRQAGLFRFIGQLYTGEQTIESIQMAQRWAKVRQDRTSGDILRELCAKIAPLALVQKSPGDIRRLVYLERMLQAFPKGRFIHLLRHPRGMSESAMKYDDAPIRILSAGGIDRSGPQPVVDPQIVWHDFHLRILRFEEMVPPAQWLRIKGEDFLADLDTHLHRVCDWLGVSTAPAAIEAMKRPEDSPFSCFGPANALLGNDPNFLHEPQLRPYRARPESLSGPLSWRPDGGSFHPRVVEVAHELGYT